MKTIKKIGKGYSSEIFLVEDKGKKLVLKKEKTKSPRIDMVEKECKNLYLANSVGIGPMLFAYDLENRVILMEFVDAFTFNEWLFKHTPNRLELHAFLHELFSQARQLDKIGLDHGQLAGKGKNILVRKADLAPVIIDFEKASSNRKCHNVSQLESFLYRSKRSAITKKVAEILTGNT